MNSNEIEKNYAKLTKKELINLLKNKKESKIIKQFVGAKNSWIKGNA